MAIAIFHQQKFRVDFCFLLARFYLREEALLNVLRATVIIKGKKATAAKKRARDESRYRAPALDTGLDILELLASVPYSKTQAEVAIALGRSQIEIHRHRERLVARASV